MRFIERGQLARVNHELHRMGWRYDQETRQWTRNFM